MRASNSAARRREAAVLLATLLVAYAYFDQGPGWQVNSRLDLLHALRHGTVSIDRYHRNTGDKARYRGHFYSEKAPGMVVAALPAFAASAAALEALDVPVDGRRGWTVSRWLATAASAGLLTALGGAALYLLLLRFVSRPVALGATAAVFLGSLAFPYATALYPHGAVIGLLAIALALAVEPGGAPGAGRLALAGAATGLAVVCEYPALFAGLAVLAWVLRCGGRGMAVSFVSGALPLLLVAPLYNFLAFDSPLRLGYVHSTNFDWAYASGVLGFGWPRPSVAWHLLVSAKIGLFVFCPALALAFAGYRPLWRRDRDLFWMSVLVPLATLLLIAAFSTPRGGWSLGPRYLSPMIPFLALPVALGLERLPRTGALLVAVSTLLMFATTAVTIAPNLPKLSSPLTQHYAPALAAGDLETNLGSLVGLEGLASLVPLLAVLVAAAVWLAVRRDRPRGRPPGSAIAA